MGYTITSYRLPAGGGAVDARTMSSVSYTHLTLPTTERV